MIRFFMSLIFLAIITVAILFVLFNGEAILLRDWLSVMPLRIDEWVTETWVELFQFWGFWGVLTSAGFVLAWLLLSQFLLNVEEQRFAGKGRVLWCGLLIALLLITIAGSFVLIPETQDWGKTIASGLLIGNALLLYWLATAMFSPSVAKYAPLGSIRLAKVANQLVARLSGGAQ